MAQKSVEALAEEQKTQQAVQSQIYEVEEDLEIIVIQCDALKASKEKDASDLKKPPPELIFRRRNCDRRPR